MSLLWIDSFEWGFSGSAHLWSEVARRYEAVNNTTAMAVGSGRTGGYGISMQSTTSYAEKQFSAKTTIIVGGAFKPTGVTSVVELFRLYDGSTLHCYLRQNADGSLSLVNGDSTVIATTTGGTKLSTSAFRYVELKVTIGNSAAYELRVDGVTEFSGTGDTQNGGSAQCTGVRLTGNTSVYYDLDDYYICDNSGSANNNFLGPIKIELKQANADGTSSQWNGSDGNQTNNWDLINDIGNVDDTDYVYESTTGDVDTYNFPNMTATAGTVVGVMASAVARKDDLSPKEIALVARPGSTDRVGDTKTLTTTYDTYMQLWETNPDTSAAWTISEFNASEFGVKAIT